MAHNRLLNLLEAIQNHPSLTSAAQSLFISQPYMSRLLKEAESQYNSILVNRKKHPIDLTYAGERLLAYLKNQAHLEQSMLEELAKIRNNSLQTLTLGITSPFADKWYAATVAHLYEHFPHIHTHLLEISTSEAEALMTDGKLDFFIGKTINKPGIATLALTTIELALVVPKSSKLYQPNSFWLPFTPNSLSKLDNEPFIRTTGETRFQDLVTHYLTDSGIHVDNLIDVRSSKTALKLALQGLGSVVVATTMLNSLDKSKSKISAFKFPISQLSLDFSVSYLPSHQNEAPLEFLLRQAQEQFTDFLGNENVI